MAELTLVEAVNHALARALQDDPAVIVFGEDVGRDGGVFRATDGLIERFGAERVLDTPIAEAAIAGVAVGMAAYGLPHCLRLSIGLSEENEAVIAALQDFAQHG